MPVVLEQVNLESLFHQGLAVFIIRKVDLSKCRTRGCLSLSVPSSICV